jgi:FkbM family methyltransferase
MRLLKKLIKCLIPYGFIVLRHRINNGIPLKLYSIKRNVKEDYLCDITIKKLAGDSNIIQIDREDYEHTIFLRNHTSDVLVYTEIIERNEYDFSVRNEPKYIIDAGANIGMASIYFANKYKKAKIIAIEPEEENFKLLKLNTENYSNITTIKGALWDRIGEISLFDTGSDNYGFMVGTNVHALKPTTKMIKHLTRAVTVEEIMKLFNIEYIDIIKIDIEGSEKEVFYSCENWIHKTRCIIVELHERMKKGCNKAFYKNIKLSDHIGMYGENIYLSKENYIEMEDL